ncbi:MAG TPA: M56 family metallopeptidase [Verrucomicrobiae bacterium]
MSFSAAEALLRWSVLLALGWIAHGLLRNRHPRWRMILWRAIFCFSLVTPLARFPTLRIPVPRNSFDWADAPIVAPAAAPSTGIGGTPVSETPRVSPAARTSASSSAHAMAFPRISWPTWLALVWIAGALWAGGRLVRLQLALHQLRVGSAPADAAVQQQARETAACLKVTRRFAVRVSGNIVSPCVCGVWKPAVLLPKKLADELSADEAPALLAHEIAHLRRHDLFWCIGWRWAQALFWPHPLVWGIPAAHALACEEEADRIAAGQSRGQAQYSQLLAGMALRILALPAAETQLALSGGSQIAKRIRSLRENRAGVWTWRDSAAAFALAAAVFVAAAGCSFTTAKPAALTFREVLVTVQDQDGHPMAGAAVRPSGFRVKGLHHADDYSWNRNLFGPPETVMTGADGKAWARYPVEGIPEEREFTASLTVRVSRAGYCSASPDDYSVERPNPPIRLVRGIVLEVSGYSGADRQPVEELKPSLTLSGATLPLNWQKTAGGKLAFDELSPGDHLLQLMGRLPSGEIVYSDTVAFTAAPGLPCSLNLEMKPGIRVEGRLDESVPRPVKNGRVLIQVRPKEFPASASPNGRAKIIEKYGEPFFWRTYRVIHEDGTFVFESVPPGELDVTALCDGFASRGVGQPNFGLPQAFALRAPVTEITVRTERTATLDFTATTRRGQPIEGVSVSLNPNALRIGGIFGQMWGSSESPFRAMAPLPPLPYDSAKTDQNGRVEIRDIPSFATFLLLNDPRYQVPLQSGVWRDRFVPLKFSPGATNELKMALEPKGADFIGGTD